MRYDRGMEIIIGCAAGALATFVMDCLGFLTVKMNWIDLKGLQIVPGLLGRWALLSFKSGADIRTAEPMDKEKITGLLLHYLIGMFLGGVFAVLPSHSIQTAGFYGVATNVFPWLVMYPAMGFGFFAAKLQIQKSILLFSFINHVVYGLSLGITYLFMRPYVL